ncbi:MAG: thioredoxin [Firmicutes bacterium]|nr:thioredoxin [Bacillota bacterium]
MVLNITAENFQKEVMECEKTVLLDFFATWCGPCRMVSPIIDEIAEENDQLQVGKIDVDAQGELAAQFHVTSIPTIVVIQNGEVINQAVGAMPKREILAMLP